MDHGLRFGASLIASEAVSKNRTEELGAWPHNVDEIGDFKLSPVPVSPTSSAFASFSPGVRSLIVLPSLVATCCNMLQLITAPIRFATVGSSWQVTLILAKELSQIRQRLGFFIATCSYILVWKVLPGSTVGFNAPEFVKAKRADAETQTTNVDIPSPLERTPNSRSRHPMAPRMLQGVWSKNGNLPACVSALAMREAEESISNRFCLRKLEMRIAPCWRNDDSLRESEHSSLQVSSTQSPSTEPNEQGNRRTPLDSFSSLSSPLDHSSVLKE